jgi:non-heme chloroperoxidase
MDKFTRRDMLIGGVATLAATTLPVVAISRSITDSLSLNSAKGDDSMATITTKDGTTICYKDWGPKNAQPIVFHHGWPLSSDDWDPQMLFFLANGYRVIAHDRRGHGRSSQVGTGPDMDHYASDASAVVEHLDLRNAIHIGHSTGGVVR